jgi:transposase
MTIAALDVHKKVLMVVLLVEGAVVARQRFLTGTGERKRLAEWLKRQGVDEVVMESTAQYWKPIWSDLETLFESGKLHLAQAHSNRARKGRKHDFKDAERLGRRLVAGELVLSYVPDPEQRCWRTMSRTRAQLVEDRTRLQNQIEALLEEANIKLSSVVTDLLGSSGHRILKALAEGRLDAAQMAELGDRRLKCSKEELQDALNVSMRPVHRMILGQKLDQLELNRKQQEELELLLSSELKRHQTEVERLAQIPGMGVQSAVQVIAEVGPAVKAFDSAAQFASWIGTCPGLNESAEQNKSAHSPKGNRVLRTVLMQCAQAAVRTKGSIFQATFNRLLVPKGYKKAVWAIAHKLSRVIWKILKDGVDYVERGPSRDAASAKHRINRMVRELRTLGFNVEKAQPLEPISVQ